ncbi:hypothetical protein CIPAW_10G130500 [Carya illinoinensis]|uniref:Uncharacterized protein n=1 Tax=Carya illinoinensis TaxID=32201 RepID=A0A8T1PFG2_CARIL|nr:hypothetical protein CIPAW_10G130500 [Carya illinoinensis]
MATCTHGPLNLQSRNRKALTHSPLPHSPHLSSSTAIEAKHHSLQDSLSLSLLGLGLPFLAFLRFSEWVRMVQLVHFLALLVLLKPNPVSLHL